MKKIIFLLLSTFVFSLTASTQPATEKIIIESDHGHDRMEVNVPKNYTIKKGGAYATLLDDHSPLWAITYENDRVILTSTHTTLAVDDNGIPAFTDQLISLVREKNREPKILDDGILLEDGKNIGYIKFYSKETDQKKYNYLFYVSAGGQLVLFSFSCPKKLRKGWETLAERVAASLRIIRQN
jgi:hypothetical protein